MAGAVPDGALWMLVWHAIMRSRFHPVPFAEPDTTTDPSSAPGRVYSRYLVITV
jgi:hypothetical protein